jgi:hypothetical protein
MKIASVFAVFLVSFVSIFAPVSISGFINPFSQGASIEEISGYQEWNTDRTIDKNIIVNPGATLVIGKGVKIDFVQPRLSLSVNGNLYVKGTLNEPVYIGSSLPDGGFFSVRSFAGSSVMMRNAVVDKGGLVAQPIGQGLVNRALAATIYIGSLHVTGGKVDVQNVTFKNSQVAVYVTNSVADVRINRSRFIDNELDVHAAPGDDFRYNWWASTTGPTKTCSGPNNTNCYYDKIEGAFDYSKHLTKESFRDPVVIVPGLVGSKEKNGVTILDPVLHTYDNLYDAFVAAGYVPEKDLFVFPYQWRDSNVDNAKLLQQKINGIKQTADWPRVDIVAHSMGGLLAREYVESNYYGNDIDQLVTIATPHLGAPEAYLKWDGDGWFSSLSDLYIKHIISQEAAEAGFADRFDYIHDRPVASIRELLPIYEYLYDIDNDSVAKVYPDDYPRNEFLENLNSKADRLYKVEFDKVVGGLDGENTIDGIDVVNEDIGKYWIHGYPLGFGVPVGSRGLRLASGDRTVPLFSSRSENLKSDNLIELPSDHRGIVTDAQKDVLKLLTGNRPQEEIRRGLLQRMLFVSVYSPIDIQIISPSDKRIGKNFETGGVYDEIPGAYYTGHDTKSEFITIPNPEDGEYKILTQGTGTGSYRIEATKIIEDENGVAKESTAVFNGTAIPDVEDEIIAVIDGDEVTSGETKDIIPPVTAASFFGTQGTNTWYTSDVTVTLSATDNEGGSGVDKIEYSLDNGTAWNAYADSFMISTEGTTILQYRSIDKAGNQEEAKATTVKIDKTKPVITGTVFPAANVNGWNTTDVEVRFVCADSVTDQSGIETDTVAGATLTTEGKNQSVTNTGECSDKAGNQADPVAASGIDIDKTAPEAKISFNPATQKLEITGTDNLSDTSVVIVEKQEMVPTNKKFKKIKDWFERWHSKHKKNLPDMLATITDQAGHITSLVFEKTEDKKGFVFVRLLSIGYDGEEGDGFENTSLVYVWNTDRRGRYVDFSSSLSTGDTRFMSRYLPKQDRTFIVEYVKRHLPELVGIDGMVVPYIGSEKGKISVKF